MDKKKLMFTLLYLVAMWNFSIEAISITEHTRYPAFCQQAVMDDAIFSRFKRCPDYRQILEHVGDETGREYLDFILQKDPKIVTLFDKFRENDAIGEPIIFDYGKYGWFSPTTLRYIKVACDLTQEFGDLSKMHIVEIGGGYGGQCKIIADLTGFASYTIIDIPEAIALTKKYLSLLGVRNVNFITNNNLSQVGSYDLIVSNYAFSEIDRSEQQHYLEHVINPTRNGYMTMNFYPPDYHLQFLSIDDFVRILHSNKRKETVKREEPNTNPTNLIVTWKTTETLSGNSPSYSQASQDQFVYFLLYKLLGKQDDGYYVEIGAGHPQDGNNSYIFEKNLGWKGISLDIADTRDIWYSVRQNSLLVEDATTADYQSILKPFPQIIDYLSLDIDSSYDIVLQKIPFNDHIFKIITIEHDFYRLGDEFREKERKILASLGYYLLCPDVSSMDLVFEDWWIHPSAFNAKVFSMLTSLDLNAKNHNQIIKIIQECIQDPDRGSCKTTVLQKIDDFDANSQGQQAGPCCADETMPEWAGEEAR